MKDYIRGLRLDVLKVAHSLKEAVSKQKTLYLMHRLCRCDTFAINNEILNICIKL